MDVVFLLSRLPASLSSDKDFFLQCSLLLSLSEYDSILINKHDMYFHSMIESLVEKLTMGSCFTMCFSATQRPTTLELWRSIKLYVQKAALNPEQFRINGNARYSWNYFETHLYYRTCHHLPAWQVCPHPAASSCSGSQSSIIIELSFMMYFISIFTWQSDQASHTIFSSSPVCIW